MDDSTLFTERQHFRQSWLWLILIGINGLFIYGIIQQVVNGQQWGTRPMSDTGLFIFFGLTLLLTLLFAAFRLDTIIKQDGIYVRFFPIHLTFRKYSWDNIERSFVKQYNPIMDYGGYGLRLGLFGKGRALNVSGNKGIQLVFTDGTRLLIGTNKPDEARQALQQLGHLTE